MAKGKVSDEGAALFAILGKVMGDPEVRNPRGKRANPSRDELVRTRHLWPFALIKFNSPSLISGYASVSE